LPSIGRFVVKLAEKRQKNKKMLKWLSDQRDFEIKKMKGMVLIGIA